MFQALLTSGATFQPRMVRQISAWVKDSQCRPGSLNGSRNARPARTSRGLGLAQGVFERAKQLGILFQLGKLAAPAADAIDVKTATLATDDACHVDEILWARRDELIDARCSAEQVRTTTPGPRFQGVARIS